MSIKSLKPNAPVITPLENTTVIGAGITSISYYGTTVYCNLAKQMTKWEVSTSATYPNTNNAVSMQSIVDNRNNILSTPTDGTYLQSTIELGGEGLPPDPGTTAGSYTFTIQLTWTGNGRITFGGSDAKSTSSNPNYWYYPGTYNVQLTYPSGGITTINNAGSISNPSNVKVYYVLTFQGQDSLGSNLIGSMTSLEMVPLAWLTQYNAYQAGISAGNTTGSNGETQFSPYVINAIKGANLSHIRTMDFIGTSTQNVMETWTNRPLQSDITSIFSPYEDVIDLANACDINLWINMPALVDDTFITNFATLLNSRLKPNLIWYLELANEIWNTSQDYIVAQDYCSVYNTTARKQINLDGRPWVGTITFTAGSTSATVISTNTSSTNYLPNISLGMVLGAYNTSTGGTSTLSYFSTSPSIIAINGTTITLDTPAKTSGTAISCSGFNSYFNCPNHGYTNTQILSMFNSENNYINLGTPYWILSYSTMLTSISTTNSATGGYKVNVIDANTIQLINNGAGTWFNTNIVSMAACAPTKYTVNMSQMADMIFNVYLSADTSTMSSYGNLMTNYEWTMGEAQLLQHVWGIFDSVVPRYRYRKLVGLQGRYTGPTSWLMNSFGYTSSLTQTAYDIDHFHIAPYYPYDSFGAEVVVNNTALEIIGFSSGNASTGTTSAYSYAIYPAGTFVTDQQIILGQTSFSGVAPTATGQLNVNSSTTRWFQYPASISNVVNGTTYFGAIVQGLTSGASYDVYVWVSNNVTSLVFNSNNIQKITVTCSTVTVFSTTGSIATATSGNVNNGNGSVFTPQQVTISSGAWSAGVGTFVLSSAMTFTVGSTVTVSNYFLQGWNGSFVVNASSGTSLTLAMPTNPGSGTIGAGGIVVNSPYTIAEGYPISGTNVPVLSRIYAATSASRNSFNLYECLSTAIASETINVIGVSYFMGTLSGNTLTVTSAVTGLPLSIGMTVNAPNININNLMYNAKFLSNDAFIVGGSGTSWTISITYPGAITTPVLFVVSGWTTVTNGNDYKTNSRVASGVYGFWSEENGNAMQNHYSVINGNNLHNLSLPKARLISYEGGWGVSSYQYPYYSPIQYSFNTWVNATNNLAVFEDWWNMYCQMMAQNGLSGFTYFVLYGIGGFSAGVDVVSGIYNDARYNSIKDNNKVKTVKKVIKTVFSNAVGISPAPTTFPSTILTLPLADSNGATYTHSIVDGDINGYYGISGNNVEINSLTGVIINATNYVNWKLLLRSTSQNDTQFTNLSVSVGNAWYPYDAQYAFDPTVITTSSLASNYSLSIKNITYSGTTVTITVNGYNSITNSSSIVTISGVTPTVFNGTFEVVSGTSSTIVVTNTGTLSAYTSGGTITSSVIYPMVGNPSAISINTSSPTSTQLAGMISAVPTALDSHNMLPIGTLRYGAPMAIVGPTSISLTPYSTTANGSSFLFVTCINKLAAEVAYSVLIKYCTSGATGIAIDTDPTSPYTGDLVGGWLSGSPTFGTTTINSSSVIGTPYAIWIFYDGTTGNLYGGSANGSSAGTGGTVNVNMTTTMTWAATTSVLNAVGYNNYGDGSASNPNDISIGCTMMLQRNSLTLSESEAIILKIIQHQGI